MLTQGSQLMTQAYRATNTATAPTSIDSQACQWAGGAEELMRTEHTPSTEFPFPALDGTKE